MILELELRILANKKAKGFPIGNINYDLKKLFEEITEFVSAYKKGDKVNMGEELADMVILTLGIASYFDINMEEEILNKMEKIEKRKISQVGHDQFTKEEGV